MAALGLHLVGKVHYRYGSEGAFLDADSATATEGLSNRRFPVFLVKDDCLYLTSNHRAELPADLFTVLWSASVLVQNGDPRHEVSRLSGLSYARDANHRFEHVSRKPENLISKRTL